MTPESRKELRRLAEAAKEDCQCDWRLMSYRDDSTISARFVVDMGYEKSPAGSDSSSLTEPLAKYIAAANPQAIIELLNRIDGLEETVRLAGLALNHWGDK